MPHRDASDAPRSVFRKVAKTLLAPKNLAFLLAVSSLFSVALTYLAIARSEHPMGPDPQRVMALIVLNLLLLLCLAVLVFRRALGLWRSLRQGSSPSKLQTRVLVMFSLLTIAPAGIVSIFAAVFFHFGVQSWFNQRVNMALEGSVAVAQAYLHEHREIIRADATAMAHDIDLQMQQAMNQPKLLNRMVNSQALLRSLTEGVIIHRNRIIAQTALSFALAFERVENDKVERADGGEVVVWVEEDEKLRAMARLHSLPDAYLIVGRLVDEKVLRHMDQATAWTLKAIAPQQGSKTDTLFRIGSAIPAMGQCLFFGAPTWVAFITAEACDEGIDEGKRRFGNAF